MSKIIASLDGADYVPNVTLTGICWPKLVKSERQNVSGLSIFRTMALPRATLPA